MASAWNAGILFLLSLPFVTTAGVAGYLWALTRRPPPAATSREIVEGARPIRAAMVWHDSFA